MIHELQMWLLANWERRPLTPSERVHWHPALVGMWQRRLRAGFPFCIETSDRAGAETVIDHFVADERLLQRDEIRDVMIAWFEPTGMDADDDGLYTVGNLHGTVRLR